VLVYSGVLKATNGRIDGVFDMTSLRFCRNILEPDLELAAEFDERIADTVHRMKLSRCA
jgi:hypothetical protein